MPPISPLTVLHIRARRILRSPWVRTLASCSEVLAKLLVFLGVLAWLWEIPDRAQQRHDAAWTLINIARGAPGEAGRKRALEGLNNDSVSLAGIDLSRAILPGINLTLANLSDAIFDDADLRQAKFGCNFLRILWNHGCTNFDHAQFHGTRLDQTDFRYGLFTRTVFAGKGGAVYEPNFAHAVIADASLERMTFLNADFAEALIARTSFSDVRFRTPFDTDASPDLFYGTQFLNVDLTKTNLTMSMLAQAKLCGVIVDGFRVNQNCEHSPNSKVSVTPP